MSIIETLKSIYRALFEQNMIAAEEDYEEYFVSNYAPDSIALDEMSDGADIKQAICHLVEEIVNDTGNEELAREWMIEAGADDELLAMCEL